MRPLSLRALVLLALVAIAAAGYFAITKARARDDAGSTRLAWVADAHQLGPVGYRDPAGAVSPDGRWIAYSEGRFLRVRPIDGGPAAALQPADVQIRNLAWSDNRTVVADGYLTATGWAAYDRIDGSRRALWDDRTELRARLGDSGTTTTAARVGDLRQLAWSPAGKAVAAIVNARDGQQLWTIAADGSSAVAQPLSMRVSFPAWTPRGEIACVAATARGPRVTIPCGGRVIESDPPGDVYGPVAFAADYSNVYAAIANGAGTVDLWAISVEGGRSRQLTFFSRDSYAPTVAQDGTVVFKVQNYRTVVALVSADGGATRPLTTFQSETPSWDPSGRRLGITFGSWRRVPDDATYPDIAQDAGIVEVTPDAPAAAPSRVVHASASEDQSLCWSPNGRWIAFHSHKDQSDDIWLRPADDDAGEPRRISFLGRGAEVGWPRWSPDGRTMLFTGANRTTRHVAAYVLAIDQQTGAPSGDATPIPITGLDGDVFHAEWLPDSSSVVLLMKEAAGRHVIATVSRNGGPARIVHRFASEHDVSGLGASPDGHDAAFVAPAADGFLQVFRMPLVGGSPRQLTTDPSHKTQPAWSPDGSRIAFTVWSYDAQFWRVRR